jgi:hypothetical protein
MQHSVFCVRDSVFKGTRRVLKAYSHNCHASVKWSSRRSYRLMGCSLGYKRGTPEVRACVRVCSHRPLFVRSIS